MLVDHKAIIRLYWHDRNSNEIRRQAVRRAITMLQSFKKHGVWPIGGA